MNNELENIEKQLATCQGKQAWPNAHSARKGISAHMGSDVKPYQCTSCGQWHLGRHRTKRKTKNGNYLRRSKG